MATALDGLNVLTRGLGEQDPAIALAQLNKKRLDEMKRNLYMQGIGGPEKFTTGATPADVQSTEEDLKNSPYGDEAAARRSQVDEQVATANRPDVQELSARDLASKLAIAAAPAEAQAQGALAVEKQKQAGSSALWDKLRGGVGGGGGMGTLQEPQINISGGGDVSASFKPRPTSANEEASLQSFAKAQPLISELEQRLGSPGTDPWSQIKSLAKNKTEKALYNTGYMTPDNTTQQLEGLLGVIGASPYASGSRSFQMIKLALQHLTQGGGSDAFNKSQLDSIRTLWPQMVSEMKAQHDNPYGLAGK